MVGDGMVQTDTLAACALFVLRVSTERVAFNSWLRILQLHGQPFRDWRDAEDKEYETQTL